MFSLLGGRMSRPEYYVLLRFKSGEEVKLPYSNNTFAQVTAIMLFIVAFIGYKLHVPVYFILIIIATGIFLLVYDFREKET
jgi:hypothetical protein